MDSFPPPRWKALEGYCLCLVVSGFAPDDFQQFLGKHALTLAPRLAAIARAFRRIDFSNEIVKFYFMALPSRLHVRTCGDGNEHGIKTPGGVVTLR